MKKIKLEKVKKIKSSTPSEIKTKRRKNTSVSKKPKTENKGKKILDLKKITNKSKNINMFFNKKYITIVIIIFTSLIAIYMFLNYHKLGIVFNKNISDEDVINIDMASSNNKIIEYKDEILVYNNNLMITYNKFGKKTWEKRLESTFIPTIDTAGSFIQVINKDSGYIYLYGNKYEIARIKIEGKIKRAKITENGISIVEYSAKGSKTTIGTYNKNGKPLYLVKLNTNTISNYVLSDNDRYLVFSEVNIKGISLSTTLKILDLHLAKSDSYQIPQIITKENELAYNIIFRGSKISVLFDEGVVTYNINTKKTNQYITPDVNLLNIDIAYNKYFYVSHNQGSEEYVFSIIEFGSKKRKTIKISEAPRHFILKDQITYISYAKKINIYNSFGVNIKNYNSPNIITKPVVFNNGKSIAFISSNKITIFTI